MTPVRATLLRLRGVDPERPWIAGRLTQAQLARKLGVSLSSLRRWEQGRGEPTGMTAALLRALESDPTLVDRIARHR